MNVKKKANFATHGSPKTKKAVKKKVPRDALPDGFSLSDGVLRAHRIHTHEGVSILEWQASFPLPPEKKKTEKGAHGMARIRAFYRELAAHLQEYIEKSLLPDAIRAYAQNEDPHKRFRHARLSLSVDCRVTEENDLCLSVVRSVRCSRGGKLLFARREGEVFSKKSGRPLPLCALRKMGFSEKKQEEAEGQQKRKKAARGGFFLRDGKIVQIEQDFS